MCSLLRGWDGACLEPAPDTVAQARDDAVAQVAQRARNPLEHLGDHRPRAWQSGQQRDGRIGTDKHLFRWTARITDDENRRGTESMIGSACALPREALSYFRRIGRRET